MPITTNRATRSPELSLVPTALTVTPGTIAATVSAPGIPTYLVVAVTTMVAVAPDASVTTTLLPVTVLTVPDRNACACPSSAEPVHEP